MKRFFYILAFLIFALFPFKSNAGFLLTQYEYQKQLKELEELGDSMFTQAVNSYEIGDKKAAIKYFKKSNIIKVLQDILVNKIDENDDDSIYTFWEKARFPFDEFIPTLALETRDARMCELAYNAALLSKEFLLNTLVTKKDSLDKRMQLYNLLKDSIKHNSQEITRLMTDTTKGDTNDSKKDIRKVQKLQDININNSFPWNNKRWSEWTSVQNALDKKSAAIEFIKITIPEDYQYAALILTKKKKPCIVPLITEKALCTLSNQDIFKNNVLYEQVWKPVIKRIGRASKIYFSPTGILHQMPIEYAVDKNGENVSNRYQIYRLSHTGILNQKIMALDSLNLCLFGDINFDELSETHITQQSTNESELSKYITRHRSYRGSLNLLLELPGTKAEIDTIESFCKQNKIKFNSFRNSAASIEAFKLESGKSHSVLHIATHGFHIDQGTNALDSIYKKYEWNLSLFNSGLAMAGANNEIMRHNMGENNRRGILTAYEISQLDLSNTDLVVMSSCNSGTGTVLQNNVWGLQQGFKMAGVHSILMTLWEIDDKATSIFMTNFYKNLINGATKQESIHNAQRELQTYDNGYYADPLYWAGFILLDGTERAPLIPSFPFNDDTLQWLRTNLKR